MFDVRLGTDSVFNRCTKALQFGVMVGFAIIGSVFNLYTASFYIDYGRSLSLILMANRLILVAQYCKSILSVYSTYTNGFISHGGPSFASYPQRS